MFSLKNVTRFVIKLSNLYHTFMSVLKQRLGGTTYFKSWHELATKQCQNTKQSSYHCGLTQKQLFIPCVVPHVRQRSRADSTRVHARARMFVLLFTVDVSSLPAGNTETRARAVSSGARLQGAWSTAARVFVIREQDLEVERALQNESGNCDGCSFGVEVGLEIGRMR